VNADLFLSVLIRQSNVEDEVATDWLTAHLHLDMQPLGRPAASLVTVLYLHSDECIHFTFSLTVSKSNVHVVDALCLIIHRTAVSKLRHKILTDKALSVGVNYKGSRNLRFRLATLDPI